MEIEDCNHEFIENNICTCCGMCCDFHDFCSEYTPTTVSYIPQKLLKYTIKNKDSVLDKCIFKILLSLSLCSFKQQVRGLIDVTNFKYRLKMEDKILLILYHILKTQSFPIALNDLLKYSSLNKYKFLKIFRNSFKYVMYDENYLSGIFERTMQYVAFINDEYDLKMYINGTLDEFCKIQKILIRSDPRKLCLAYLLQNVKNVRVITKLADDCSSAAFNYMKRQIKKVVNTS